MAAVIAKNMERMSRNVVPADLLTIMQDADLFEMHEQQIEIERNQDNTLDGYYFAPLTEKTVYEKVFKFWDDNVTFTPSLRLMSRRLTLTLLMSS